mmetsp:Transcript_28315/g.41643  ORF Transcript_28315/g.41643 Transcript_28315/m.41643 type:complete len:242 (-) Transcript_28315:840-1565(-)
MHQLSPKLINITITIHKISMRRTTHDLRRNLDIPFFHQYLHRTTEHPRPSLRSMFQIEHINPAQTISLDIVRDLILPICSWSVGSRRIRSGINAVKDHFIHEVQRLLELFLGFTWKSDNDIGRYRRIGQFGANAINNFQKLFTGIPSSHIVQDFIAPTLKWDVEIETGSWGFRDGIHHAHAHVLGVRGDEAQPLQPRDVAHGAQQIAEFALGYHIPTIRVNVLTEQRHFFVPIRYQFSHFL